jgi:hypothetical protein
MAIAARINNMATTISSSINENPRWARIDSSLNFGKSMRAVHSEIT